jgi:DNA-binding response OmpR family regulator
MTNGWRILILDQHEDVLLHLEHLLETAGFDTTLAWHMDAFRRYLGKSEYDLIIIGHHPPEIDAGEVLRSLHPVRPQTIVLTGATRHPFEEEYLHGLGADAVFSKWNRDLATCIRKSFPSVGNVIRAS